MRSLKEQSTWELTNKETSLREADLNLKILLGVFLAMQRYQVIVFGKISICCKALDAAMGDLLPLHCKR